MITTFRIGDGEKVSAESVKPVYRNYKDDLDIEMTPELFEELSQNHLIYYSTNQLANIVFTPKNVMKQDTTQYYFCHLDVKIPRA